MTDRLKGVWVAFDEDIRVDDAEPILQAIRQIRHVEAVNGQVSSPDDWMARMRLRAELRTKFFDAWQAMFKDC